jgi:hypothetical protein
MTQRTFTHIINLYNSANELEKQAMDITCQSITRALKHEGSPDVKVLIACNNDDYNALQNNIGNKVILKENIHDFFPTSDKRKLPLLREIIQLAYDNCNSEYIIYSNADIALLPNFYYIINKWLDTGCDALIINRRRISKIFATEPDLELHYAEAGLPHPGFDCYVFKKSLVPSLQLANVCIGIPHAENLLAHNLFIKSGYCKLVTDAHITYHIGTILHNNWGTYAQARFNKKQYLKELRKMKNQIKIENYPGAELSLLKRHFKWLMNPSFHYPTMFWADITQLNKKRRKNTKKEKHNFKNRYLGWLIKKINFD